MAKGSALFSSLFDEITADQLPADIKKGRNDALNAKRNECLIARYYYLGKFSNMRYTNVMRKLSAEFYLSERTIVNIVQDESTTLQKLKKERPASTWFEREFPHLVWPKPSALQPV